MYSAGGNAVLPALGFPIRESADQWLFSAYPRLFAAVHALLRLLVPRHPPCALLILTVIRHSFGPGGPSKRPVIPVLVGSDRRDRCQLAWLCSFQGPQRGARPGLGRSVSQNSTACTRPRDPEGSRAAARGGRREPGPVDVQEADPARPPRYAMDAPNRPLHSWSSLERR